MSNTLTVVFNGQTIEVRQGCSVAAAVLSAKHPSRCSVRGEPRAPLCGMGICMECRATVNGVQHVRTCQIVCEAGMEIEAQ
jgi:D-hydroxyproline dehydrogenase subunit gamma